MNADRGGVLPLVSVITLVYNTGNYVVEALQCVQEQNYPNIQHIIIDDCSIDDSATVVENWINTNHYNCQFIKHEKNKGVQKTLEEAFSFLHGKYFVLLSDDLWTANSLMERVNLFEKLEESYTIVYGDTNIIDKDGNIVTPSLFAKYMGQSFSPPSGDIFREILNEFYFYSQASIFRLEHFRKMNFEFDKSIISEDWDWQLRLSREYNILGVNKVYASYRWLDTSVGRTNWTDDKIHNVWISQAKMILRYYNHPKNPEADKQAIFARVERLYQDVVFNSRASLKQKVMLFAEILKSTKKIAKPLIPVKKILRGNMSLKKLIQKGFNLFGVSVIKNEPVQRPGSSEVNSPDNEVQKFSWLKEFDFKTIIDVGSNEGQFAKKILSIFPNAEIHCFEPLREAFGKLEESFKGKKNVFAYNCGLGQISAEMDIFKNEFSPSSSLLPMLDLHKSNFSYAVEVEPEKIQIRKLDEVLPARIITPTLVKIDVQGYEMNVIKGGENIIKQADAIIIETSFYALYKGQPLFEDIYNYFTNNGFKYFGNLDQLVSPVDSRILHADAVFLRKEQQ